MTLDALIMFLGGFVAVLPFLGFPNSWDTVLLFLAGVVTVVLGIIVRQRLGHHHARGNGSTFVESLPDRQAGPSAERAGEPRMSGDHGEI